jgi:single-strand DNA-binding protein
MNNAQITVVGRITSDPELKFVGTDGKARLAFGIAVDRSYKDPQGEWVNQASFFNVVAWGRVAEDAARSLAKGVKVIIPGRFEVRQYDKDGEKKTAHEIIADQIAIDTFDIGPDFTRYSSKDTGEARVPVGAGARSAGNGRAAPSRGSQPFPDEEAW